MIEKLTPEQRDALNDGYDARNLTTGAWLGAGRAALRIIDQLTEALAAQFDLTQRSQRLLIETGARLDAAEARVRELTEALGSAQQAHHRAEGRANAAEESLEAERAETADWLQVSRDWRVRAEDAEAQVRDFKVRHAAASSILAGAGTFLDSAALEALQGPAPAAAPSSRPRAALRRLRAMLLERGEAELIRLVDLALKDGAG